MNKISTTDKIYISKSNISGAGRGVFARSDIKKSELVETCPFIELPNDSPFLNEASLVEYVFFFGKDKERVALFLGFGSLYNHSDEPNAMYEIKPEERLVDFVATKDIKKDDEITFDYRGEGDLDEERSPLWFEV